MLTKPIDIHSLTHHLIYAFCKRLIVLNSFTYTPAEIAHILKMTKPKIIFCDSNNVLCIRDSLKLLKTTVPIFAFGGKVDGARMVEELFIPCESEDTFW